MKIRTDFVSNSSSSSFIVAINGSYDIKRFIGDIAKETSNPKSEYHRADIAERNRRIMDFCLNTYQLAFLGTWTVKTDERIYTEEQYDKKFGQGLFKLLIKDIEYAKKPGADEFSKKIYGRDFVDPEGNAHVFIDYDAYGIAVDFNTMSYEFNRSDWADEEFQNRKDQRDIRLRNLRDLAKRCSHDQAFITKPDIYQITINTIRNTRDLLAAGEKIELARWENLDELEKRLSNGERLIAIKNNYEGDGMDPYSIYSEDGSKGMNGFGDIAMEYIGNLD